MFSDLLSRFFSFLRREKLAYIITSNSYKKKMKNKYMMIDYYVEHDSSLYGTLRFIGLTVGAAYKQYTKQHKDICREAYSIAFNLMKYGDVVIRKKTQKMLPNYSLTIIDSEDKLGVVTNDVITEANYYVLDEMNIQKRKVFKRDEVIHLSLNNEGTTTQDLLGRYCYGIYSIPPTLPLLKILEWKEFLIDSDIMWRDRMVPREHHILDLDIGYDMIPGKTLEEKRKNAEAYVQEQLSKYVDSIANLEAGEHYVTTKDVQIEVIEPKTKYNSPNELVDQLTDIIISSFNVPLSAVKGKAKSSYAAELAVASYFMLTANSLVDIINGYFEWKYPETDFSNAHVTLEIWKTEIFKRAALAAKIGVFTKDEIREIAGYPKTNDKDIITGNIDGRTIDGIIRSTDPSDVETPLRNDTRNKTMKDRSIEEVK